MKFSIWRGLRGASAPAKLLYSVLLTDDSVNYSGVGRYCPELWAENAEMPVDRIEKALTELVDGNWVVVDGFSFLIRTMIRNDGIAEQPNMLKAALREAQQVHSVAIRKVLAAELRKLPQKRPDTVKAGKTFSHPDPHAVADELDPPPLPPAPDGPDDRKGSAKGSGNSHDPWLNPSGEPFAATLPAIPSSNGSSEGISETPGGRGGGRGRGLPPVDENSISTEPPSAGDSVDDPTGFTLALVDAEPAVTAHDVVARWAEGFDTTGNKPVRRLREQVGREARDLLAAGNDPDRILIAAHILGQKGRATLVTELAIQSDTGRHLQAVSGDSRFGQRHRNYRNPPESAYDEPMYPQEGQ